jgi:rare lipoprotein A
VFPRGFSAQPGLPTPSIELTMRLRNLHLLLLALVLPAGCAASGERHAAVHRGVEEGVASYYASSFQGRPTASGRPYDERQLTAAHRTLPFGTRVRVTNLSNGRRAVVKITDRGPARRDRVIDVSRRAAQELGFERAGITRVRMEVVSG